MSAALTITAEFIDGEIFLTVEHGNAEDVQTLRLTRAEILVASATAAAAIATGETAASHFPKGLKEITR